MQNEMKYRFARWKRTGPVAFQGGGASLRLRFVNGWSLGGCRGKSSEAEERDGQGQTPVSRLHRKPPHSTLRMVDDSSPKRVGITSGAERRESSIGLNFGRPEQKKAAHRSVPPKSARNRSRPSRAGYFPCFAYQSALMGVKLFHFSGRSSSAKIAVTGQTGTHAPQSMHSVG